jgi:hypothetical protein
MGMTAEIGWQISKGGFVDAYRLAVGNFSH